MSHTFRILLLVHGFFLFLASLLIEAKETPAAVAFKCGKPALYLTPLGWASDDQQVCLHRESDIVAYCQRVYKNPSLVHAAFTQVIDVHLPDWCHRNLSDCQLPTENRTYPIQPWICSAAAPAPLTVPVDCFLKHIDDPRQGAYSCHKANYWHRAARQSCESNHTTLLKDMPVKPCIKVDAYDTMHYMGTDVVCCADSASPYDHEPESSSESSSNPVGLSQSLFGSADTSLIISNDERLYNAYLATDSAQTPDTKAREKQQFKSAKMAEKEAYEQRQHMLQEQLEASEARLSAADWLTNPEQTQEAEDALHNEFIRKYVLLDEENRQLQHRLDSTHWKHVLSAMEHRKQIMLEQWNKTLSEDRANLTEIKRAAEHLLHTIENQRAHVIRRFERVRKTDPMEARGMLPDVRQRLADLEQLLSNSLAKLDKIPALKLAVLQHVAKLRKSRYAELDASAKAIAVMSDVGEQGGIRFPAPSEQAALRAAKVISKYEHRLLRPEPKTPAFDSAAHHVKPNPTERPSGRLLTTVPPPTSSSTGKTHPERNNISPPIISYPKSTGHKAPDSTEDIVVEIHLPTERPTSPIPIASAVGHPQQQTVTPTPKRNKAAIVVPVILACLVFFVAVVFVARCYVHRMRLQRAGYNLTVVEVDEVSNTDASRTTRHGPHLPRLGRGRLAVPSGVNATSGGTAGVATAGTLDDHDPVDPLARWQVNGYENPAYKFTEGGYTFSPMD